MTKERLEYFSNFFFDLSHEDIQTIKEELEEAGIKTEQARESILGRIKKAKVELKIEKGKKIYKALLDRIASLKADSGLTSFSDTQLQAAFRKLEKELTQEELTELINEDKKLDILEKLIREGE